MAVNGTGSGAFAAGGARKSRRGLKIALGVVVALVVVLAVVVAMAPTIASGIAPGKIEEAAAGKIKGKVKVSAVSIGWFSPTEVGPIEVIDPSGRTAARVTLKMPATVWKIVSERWWSTKRLDLGEIEVAGMLDIVRDAKSGETNLEQAVEPRQPQPKQKAESPSQYDQIKGLIRITQLDATVRDRDASGQLGPELGVKGLKGPVSFDYAARPMAIAATADLSGAPVGGGAANAEPVRVKLDANVKPKASGGLDSFKVNADVAGLPVAIVDAVAAQHGALTKGLGPKADVRVKADGSLQNGTATLVLASQGVQANLGFAIASGVLMVQAPVGGAGAAPGAVAQGGEANHIQVQSTEFLASIPALRDGLAKAAQNIQLDKAPGIDITIEKLRWPLPPSVTGAAPAGATGAQGPALADMRGSGMDIRVRVGAMSGKVAIDQPGPSGGPSQNWRPFAVEPIELAINAADLAQPLNITGGTRATIDGSPAGELVVHATATGLLDGQGHLRAALAGGNAGIAENLDADVRLNGMSTALLQPIVAGMGAGLDLKQDVGPTVNLAVQAKADIKGAGAAPAGAGAQAGAASSSMPPVDATVNLDSANMKVAATGRYAGNVVSTTGDGVRVSVKSATPIVQRMLAATAAGPAPTGPNSKPVGNNAAPPTPQSATPSLVLSGPGQLTLEVKDFSAPVDKLKGAEALAAVKALITAEVAQIAVLPGTAPAGAQPVQVQRASVNVRLDGANPPKIELGSTMSHEGTPFGLTGQIELAGIRDGKLPGGSAKGGSTGGAVQIIAFKPTGRIEAKDLPRSLANLVPAASMAGTAPVQGADMSAQIARALRESIGNAATLTVTTQPEGDAQTTVLKLTTAAGGVAADVATRLTDKAITVPTLTAVLAMDPRTVNPVLAAANQPPAPGADGARAAAPAGPPIQLGQPFKVTVRAAEPITVPLRPGSFEPDYATASDLAVTLATDNDIAIENVPVGGGGGAGTDGSGAPRTTGVRIKGLKGDARVPLAALSDQGKSKKLTANFSAKAARSDGDATIAEVTGSATSTLSGEGLEANVSIGNVDCAVAEGLIGKPGLLTGALGNKADASVKVVPTGSKENATTTLTASLTAPKVTDAHIELVQSGDRMALTKPATIAWRPDPAFLNAMLFTPSAPPAGGTTAPAPGSRGGKGAAAAAPSPQPSAVSVTQIAPVAIKINKLTLSSSKTENGQQTAGPLKPGVFDLEASVTVPNLAMTAVGTNGAPATPITLDGITMSVKQEPGAGGQGGAAGALPEIVAQLGIDRVSGAPPAAAAPGGNAPAPASAGKRSSVTLRLGKLADARGVIDTKAMVVNLDADVAAFPTPIIDGLAHQNGVLVELLGPTVDAQATMHNVSSGGGNAANASGTIQMKASSARASAELQGDVREGAFVQTGPVNFRITEITPALIKSFAGAVPVVDSVQKTSKDEPGTAQGTGLRVPIDGDLTKLNGDMLVSLGTAQFTTKSIFSSLIEAFGGNAGGSLGQRIEPFHVRADRGVLNYDRFKLPVGQFSVETRGTVDLVRRQIDVVTYAPLGSLTTKALGDLNTGVAGKLGLFDKTTMVPIVTKGSLDNPSTNLDIGLFAKEQAQQLTKDPGKLINNVLDLFGKDKGAGGGGGGGGGGAAPQPASPEQQQNPKQPTNPKKPKKP